VLVLENSDIACCGEPINVIMVHSVALNSEVIKVVLCREAGLAEEVGDFVVLERGESHIFLVQEHHRIRVSGRLQDFTAVRMDSRFQAQVLNEGRDVARAVRDSKVGALARFDELYL